MSEHDSTCPLPALPNVTGVQFRLIEEWPGYCVGDDGSVWGCVGNRGTLRVIQPIWTRKSVYKGTKGYLEASLRGSGRSRSKRVHVLVLEAFVSKRPVGMVACHGNGVKTDNRHANLRWDTPAANARDTVEHGHSLTGERHPRAILTEVMVLQIRADALTGEDAASIARRYGISRKTAYGIIARYKWKHI